jgi:hypothetical protein
VNTYSLPCCLVIGQKQAHLIGQANLGVYRVFLWNPDAELVKQGANDDEIADKFPIGTSVATLDGRLLTWQITIQSLTNQPGELYSATVTITQDSQVLVNGSYSYRDKLEGAKLIVGGVRFKVS